MEWAERIGQSKVYDAQYLALAESLEAESWSVDRWLANAAERRGYARVHCVTG